MQYESLYGIFFALLPRDLLENVIATRDTREIDLTTESKVLLVEYQNNRYACVVVSLWIRAQSVVTESLVYTVEQRN